MVQVSPQMNVPLFDLKQQHEPLREELRAAQYDGLHELLEDQREQKAVLRYSMGQAAKVARENPY